LSRWRKIDQTDAAEGRDTEAAALMRDPMNPVDKALWFVESHFGKEITLDDVANNCGVSRFHVTRAFAATTGQPIMRYTRSRRLSVAARTLADGAPDILAVALDAGYSSHEAFTRAFRDEFGLTPEQVRAQRHLQNLKLVEAIKMVENLIADFPPPRIVNSEALLITGLNERYTCESSSGIPAQWQRFLPRFGSIPGQIGHVAYGVNYNSDEAGNFSYLCGVEVPDFSRLVPGFDGVRIPAQRHAVFTHSGHISTIRSTWSTIWRKWFPESGYEVADAPSFERYGENFNSQTGMGGLEIWVPIRG
jgi:AraC family transcriptional regulator